MISEGFGDRGPPPVRAEFKDIFHTNLAEFYILFSGCAREKVNLAEMIRLLNSHRMGKLKQHNTRKSLSSNVTWGPKMSVGYVVSIRLEI